MFLTMLLYLALRRSTMIGNGQLNDSMMHMSADPSNGFTGENNTSTTPVSNSYLPVVSRVVIITEIAIILVHLTVNHVYFTKLGLAPRTVHLAIKDENRYRRSCPSPPYSRIARLRSLTATTLFSP